MDTLEAIATRRSVRQYTDRAVPKELIEKSLLPDCRHRAVWDSKSYHRSGDEQRSHPSLVEDECGYWRIHK